MFNGIECHARWLAAAFVLYGLLATALLAVNVPPFQNPDEPTHFLRAVQIAQGTLLGSRFTLTDTDGSPLVLAGGPVDPAVAWALSPFESIPFHPGTHATRTMWEPGVHWSRRRANMSFGNTAVNPPVLYVPAAIGVLLGRATRMTVLQTLLTSRLLTGITATSIAGLAILWAGGAAVWLFAILTLPMSLSLIASTSQDALMLACAALAGGLSVRALRSPGDRDRKTLAGITVALILVATSRPPYGALALLPLGLTRLPWRPRILAAAAVAACVLLWSGIAATTALVNFSEKAGFDPAAQLARLRADPPLLVHATWQALTQYWPAYLDQFVGQLSWLDVQLPPAYHVAANAMLVVAAVAAMLGLRGERIGVLSRAPIAAGVLLAAGGIFAIEYVYGTVPGTAAVAGVQGRYFLPLALAGVAVLPRLGDTRWARLHNVLVLAVALFPVVSLAVVMHAVLVRYYLG